MGWGTEEEELRGGGEEQVAIHENKIVFFC